jgi:hypothetical protein
VTLSWRQLDEAALAFASSTPAAAKTATLVQQSNSEQKCSCKYLMKLSV